MVPIIYVLLRSNLDFQGQFRFFPMLMPKSCFGDFKYMKQLVHLYTLALLRYLNRTMHIYRLYVWFLIKYIVYFPINRGYLEGNRLIVAE